MVNESQSAPMFSLLHAAKRFPQCYAVWRAWSASCTDPSQCEYIIAVHESDSAIAQSTFATANQQPHMIPVTIAVQNGRDCCVDNWNAAAQASKGKVLVTVADDLFPCEKWDGELTNFISSNSSTWGIAQFVIATNDRPVTDWSKRLINHPIMSRALYQRWGYLFYPQYESMYCDNDLTEHAISEGVLIEARHIHFDHRHPLFGKGGMDATYQRQNRPEAYAMGQRILEMRRKAGFGPIADLSAIRPAPSHKPMLVVCTPGEWFSWEWVGRYCRMIVELSAHFRIQQIYGVSSNVYAIRQQMLDDARAYHPDYVLWLDDDNLVTTDNVMRLLEDLKEHPEFDMAVGWCWVFRPPHFHVSAGHFTRDGQTEFLTRVELRDAKKPDLWQVDSTGFPLVLMRATAIDKAQRAAKLEHPDRGEFDPVLGPNGKYMGEDCSFCWRLKEAGGMIVLDRRVKVPHMREGQMEPPTTQAPASTLSPMPMPVPQWPTPSVGPYPMVSHDSELPLSMRVPDGPRPYPSHRDPAGNQYPAFIAGDGTSDNAHLPDPPIPKEKLKPHERSQL